MQIIADRAIRLVSKLLPKTIKEFADVESVGKTRAEKYGARFVNCVLDFLELHPNLQPKEVGGDADDLLSQPSHIPNSYSITTYLPPSPVTARRSLSNTPTKLNLGKFAYPGKK